MGKKKDKKRAEQAALMTSGAEATAPAPAEKVQTGVRIERRILKVLKAMAEVHDVSLGELLEGIVLHSFEGKAPFGAESRKQIDDLRRVYGLDLTAEDSRPLG